MHDVSPQLDTGPCCPHISIIIPVLNEELAIADTLRNVASCAPDCEIIVADGGSTDSTRKIVQEFQAAPVVWIDAPRGRGNQMNAGAGRATGEVLLFLHADTHLPPDAPTLIAAALTDARCPGGFFRIRFVPRAVMADIFTWGYNLRSNLRLCYGDAALFVRREVFTQMGGYRAELLMEDVEFITRLRRRGAFAYVRQGAVTSSARRFPTFGAGMKMLVVWSLLLVLFACGVKQQYLEKLYPHTR